MSPYPHDFWLMLVTNTNVTTPIVLWCLIKHDKTIYWLIIDLPDPSTFHATVPSHQEVTEFWRVPHRSCPLVEGPRVATPRTADHVWRAHIIRAICCSWGFLSKFKKSIYKLFQGLLQKWVRAAYRLDLLKVCIWESGVGIIVVGRTWGSTHPAGTWVTS